MASKKTSMSTKTSGRSLVASLNPEKRGDPGTIFAVIETPQGSRNKYRYDEKLGQFVLSKVLPAGSEFPWSFGFVPKTLSEDGDPLDVLLLADEPIPVGCVVPARLIGVMEAEKVDGNDTERNDRLIAVASESRDHEDLKSFKKLNKNLMHEIEHFFVSYHQESGKKFRILACRGPKAALDVLKNGKALYRRKGGAPENGS